MLGKGVGMELLKIGALVGGVTLSVTAATGVIAAGAEGTARPPAAVQKPGSAAGLQDWVTAFRARALAAGIDGAVFDRAMQTVRYDPQVIRRDRNQSEFTKTIWAYLETATSDLRVTNGKKALAEQADALSQIETRYGVEKEIVTAIWGLESAYGTFRGSDPVLSSLATLAYDGRRRAFFEGELLDALRAYPRLTNSERITFEYVMLKDVNDSDADARRLVNLIQGIPAKINLIPFNEWPGAPYKRSDTARIKSFADIVYKAGYASPIRTPRGEDIMAACGQLKSATERQRKSRAQIAAETGTA